MKTTRPTAAASLPAIIAERAAAEAARHAAALAAWKGAPIRTNTRQAARLDK